jgi:hypothetical protein
MYKNRCPEKSRSDFYGAVYVCRELACRNNSNELRRIEGRRVLQWVRRMTTGFP